MNTLACRLVALAALIVPSLVSPDSALAYALKRTASGEPVGWADKEVVLHIDSEMERSIGRDDVRAAAVIAAEAWRGLPGVPDIRISQGTAPPYRDRAQGGNNGIYLIGDWPYDRRLLAVTVSSYTPQGRLLGADVLVNAEHEFAMLAEDGSDASSRAHDLAAVLAHEFGHVLGLDEEFDDESATMYPYIDAGDTHQRTIEHDDEQGVIEVYQELEQLAAAAACTALAPGAGFPAPRVAPALAVALLLLRRRRRR